MDKHCIETLQFVLAEQAERLAQRKESGEKAVARWIKAGVPQTLATDVAQKSVNDNGFIDPVLFTQCMDERLRAADALRLLLSKPRAS